MLVERGPSMRGKRTGADLPQVTCRLSLLPACLRAVAATVLMQLQHCTPHRLLALDLLELVRSVPKREIQDGANNYDCKNPDHSLSFLPNKADILILPKISLLALTKFDRGDALHRQGQQSVPVHPGYQPPLAGHGEIKEATEWFNVEAWEGFGEVCQEYLQKGSLVHIENRLQTDRYEHEGETHYFIKGMTLGMQMLDRPEKEAEPVLEVGEGHERPEDCALATTRINQMLS
jgi:hypothetical protein